MAKRGRKLKLIMTPELAKKWSEAALFFNNNAERWLREQKNFYQLGREEAILKRPVRARWLLRIDRRKVKWNDENSYIYDCF